MAALLILLAVLVAGCGGGAEARTGQPAPAITGTALDGTAIDLADYRGHPVVVNFWASWCVPCREEFPLLQERYETLGARDGLVVLGVLYKDEAGLASKFADEFGTAWPTVTDPGDAIAKAYRVVAPPQTYFIDAEGVVRGIQIGEIQAEDFDTQYAKIAP